MDIINMMWFGTKLSNNELLSLNSFLKNGHTVHLYIYDNIINLPKHNNLKIFNGIDIYPTPFTYQTGKGIGSYSAFSNIFRYKLLYEQGGYWCDFDMICIKPFNFKTEYVFALEKKNMIASCVIKCPPKSDIMKFCYEYSTSINPQLLNWGDIGPKLLNLAVNKFKLNQYCLNTLTFCPFPWDNITFILNNDVILNNNTYGIHLWNEIWRRQKLNKNMKYKGLYNKLFTKYCL